MFSKSSRCISSLVNLKKSLVSILEYGLGVLEEWDILDQGVHDRLGDHVDHCALDNVEVRRNQEFCMSVNGVSQGDYMSWFTY
jgi:hypothetical protein